MKGCVSMSVKADLKKVKKWSAPYEAEVQYKGQIVFFGASNFTRWSTEYGMKPLRECLLGKSGAPCVVNRGIGGSNTEHQLCAYPTLIRPLEPKVLVYSAGFGNGLSDGYSLEELWELAQRVLVYARTDFPDMPVYLCGSTLNGKRGEEYLENVKRWDAWLRDYAEKAPNCTFVDVAGCEALQRMDIYVEDRVHYNQEGYLLYEAFFKEVLKEELEQF